MSEVVGSEERTQDEGSSKAEQLVMCLHEVGKALRRAVVVWHGQTRENMRDSFEN